MSRRTLALIVCNLGLVVASIAIVNLSWAQDGRAALATLAVASVASVVGVVALAISEAA